MTTPTQSPSEKLYSMAMALKGTYISLDLSIPKEFNCAETISFILKQCGYNIPDKGYPGTASIEVWLEENCDELDEPEFGCIINAITQGNNHGHVAINGHNALLSNDSQSGTLESYWSLSAFQDYYGVQKGLKIKYFRVK